MKAFELPSCPGLVERTFAAFALLMLTGHLLPYLAHRGPGPVVGAAGWPPEMLVAYLTLYAMTGLLLLVRWRAGVAYALRDPWLLALILFAVVSMFWTPDPMVGVRRLAGLAGTFLIAVYVVSRFSLREWIALLFWALAAGAAASIAYVLLAPDLAVHQIQHKGAWRGIFTHKNELGRLMVLGILTGVAYIAAVQRARWLGVGAVLVLMLGLAVLSGSRTAWVLLVLIVVGAGALRGLDRVPTHRRQGIISAVAAILVGAVVLALFFGDAVLTVFERDASLTGRVPLWAILWGYALERPWLGYGYGGFWVQSTGLLRSLWEVVGWKTPTAHNGYLDLLLQLGAVGALLFGVSLLRTVSGAWRLATGSRDAVARVPLLILAFLLVLNLVESFLLLQNSLMWALYIMVALSVPGRVRGADRAAGGG